MDLLAVVCINKDYDPEAGKEICCCCVPFAVMLFGVKICGKYTVFRAAVLIIAFYYSVRVVIPHNHTV